jgi:hypothetical protein
VKGRRIEATTATMFDKESFTNMRCQFDCTAANTYDPGVMTTAITLEEAIQHLRQSVAGVATTTMMIDDEFRDRDRATVKKYRRRLSCNPRSNDDDVR